MKLSFVPPSASPRFLVALILYVTLLLSNTFHDRGSVVVVAKEIEATKEWQRLGENDTVPAGLHIRMDMTTGEKWAKLPDNDEDDETEQISENDNVSSSSTATAVAAVIQPDGSVQQLSSDDTQGTTKVDGDNVKLQYDFEMMHRTLSKLPKDEMERFGGLPELPTGSEGPTRTILTSKERQAFEKRMAEIWEQRQAMLKEAQAQLLDVPEVLKERMAGIREYLQEPLEQLEKVDLDREVESRSTSDIITLLRDLEYQLTDVDNARDFHTLGGWELLVSLLFEELHVQNKTINKLSRGTEAKIRAVQAHAAWTIGTAVKNTGEFHSYAVEPLMLAGRKQTTALDLLLEVFCQEYKEENWPVRTLLAKSIYAIGSLLRGNRISQAYLIQNNNGAARLSDKLRHMVMGNLSGDIKVIQRLLSLASDLVTDIQLDGEASTATLNEAVIDAFTSPTWCDAVSTLLISDVFLPVRVQETIMETVLALAPHCSDTTTRTGDSTNSSNGWKEKSAEHRAAIARFQNHWKQNQNDFDSDHFNQLNEQALALSKVL